MYHIKPKKAQIQFTVTLTVYWISAAVFNLDDMLPLNLPVEVENGLLSRLLCHQLKIRTGIAISLLLLLRIAA